MGAVNPYRDISIHVPREGDDNLILLLKRRSRDFNPRPP